MESKVGCISYLAAAILLVNSPQRRPYPGKYREQHSEPWMKDKARGGRVKGQELSSLAELPKRLPRDSC